MSVFRNRSSTAFPNEPVLPVINRVLLVKTDITNHSFNFLNFNFSQFPIYNDKGKYQCHNKAKNTFPYSAMPGW